MQEDGVASSLGNVCAIARGTRRRQHRFEVGLVRRGDGEDINKYRLVRRGSDF